MDPYKDCSVLVESIGLPSASKTSREIRGKPRSYRIYLLVVGWFLLCLYGFIDSWKIYDNFQKEHMF